MAKDFHIPANPYKECPCRTEMRIDARVDGYHPNLCDRCRVSHAESAKSHPVDCLRCSDG